MVITRGTAVLATHRPALRWFGGVSHWRRKGRAGQLGVGVVWWWRGGGHGHCNWCVWDGVYPGGLFLGRDMFQFQALFQS